jgi:hypothetical protein
MLKPDVVYPSATADAGSPSSFWILPEPALPAAALFEHASGEQAMWE